MKAQKSWFSQKQPNLAGVRVGASQDLGSFRVAALVRDQPLEYGTMVRAERFPKGPFLRPHGFIFNDDGEYYQRLETQLYADPRELPSSLIGMVRFDDAARHSLFKSFTRFQEYGRDTHQWRLQKEIGPPNPYRRGKKSLVNLVEQFELAENQVGAMLFLNDRLYATLILPDPVSYRQVHPMLLTHVFGEIYWWQELSGPAYLEQVSLKAADVADLSELKSALNRKEQEANEVLDLYRDLEGAGFMFRPMVSLKTEAGPRLEAAYFTSRPGYLEDGFVGEWIVDGSGRTCFFKSILMDKYLRRQVPLLMKMEQAGWRIKKLMDQEGWNQMQLERACTEAACEYLLRDHWLF